MQKSKNKKVQGFLDEILIVDNEKYRRHLKIKSIDDVKNKNVDLFVKQAI